MLDASRSEPSSALLQSLSLDLAPGGRDQRLLDRQVLLTTTTKVLLYEAPVVSEPAYLRGASPPLENMVAELTAGKRPGLATIVALSRAVSHLRERPYDAHDRSEAEVFASGEATAIERARVLAAAAQVSGIAARLCLLYGTGPEPAFHAVCELGVMGNWAVFDPLANQSYLVTHHPYASAWDLLRRPAIVDAHPEHGSKPTIDSAFYRVIGIASCIVEG